MLKKNVLMALSLLAMAVSCGPYKTTPNGLKYEMIADSAGKTAELGGFVAFDMIMKTSKDSVLQNSFEGGQPMWVEVFKPTYNGCFYEGLQLLSEGDSVRFVVQADSFFLKTLGDTIVPEKINPKEELTLLLKVRKVYDKNFVEMERKKMEEQGQLRLEQMTKQVALDSALISDHLKAKNIKAQRTSQGVYIQYTKNIKTGVNLMKGDSVSVFYVGRLLDGTEFDRSRNEPLPLTLGTRQVIPGWEDALLHMKKGEKATIYIPSAMAYGDRDMQTIPANSVLVFDIEIVNK
jgi:FKBP-type peptidyl-prolyl cis-trans isomerase FkpA